VSKEARGRLHEEFAGWVEHAAAERVGEYEEIIGYHLEHAYRYRVELRPVDAAARALARRGATRLTGAGQRALASGDVMAARNLLSRAVSLLPAGDPSRTALLPVLGEALLATGDFEGAEAVLAEAVESAADSGDRGVEAYALLGRAWLRLLTQPEGGAAAARETVERAIPVFQALGDEGGLAVGGRLLGIVQVMWGKFGEAEGIMEQAAMHARRAGDRREELESLSWLPLIVWGGPTPPEEGIARCQEILEQAGGDRRIGATVLFIQALYDAMLGRFVEARDRLARSREILEDLGLQVWMVGPFAQTCGRVELLAGDPAAAEAALQPACERLEQMGEYAWLPTGAGLLVQALYAQRRYDEAESVSVLSEQAAASDDVYSQVLWRAGRAKASARRGRMEDAERLGREAVALAETTDFLQLHGEALSDLAEVLALAGRTDEALDLLRQAITVFEQKGSDVSVRDARRRAESPQALA